RSRGRQRHRADRRPPRSRSSPGNDASGCSGGSARWRAPGSVSRPGWQASVAELPAATVRELSPEEARLQERELEAAVAGLLAAAVRGLSPEEAGLQERELEERELEERELEERELEERELEAQSSPHSNR